jgi:3-hydroxyacyl-CoA dehydrogenase/enoyl-CoA hydratase/3-hydroxybutyryl-CoA epimerase
MSDQRSVTFQKDDSLGVITIDIPGEKLNVLRSEVVQELEKALSEAESASDLTGVLVRSGKPNCFVAGADLKEILRIDDGEVAREESRVGQEMMSRVENLSVPTVALINGTCLGGGLELALACDFRITTDNEATSLGLPETSLGIVPGFGGTYRLPKTLGMAGATRMILSGKPVDGKAAYKRGLADAYYPTAFHEEWTRTKFLPHALSGKGRKKIAARRKRKPLAISLSENNPLGRAVLFRRAKKQVLAKTGGNYPAPLRALALLRKVPRSGAGRAFERERKAIGDLLPSSVAKNLIGIFLSREAAKQQKAIRGDAGSVEQAVVLGAGVMGGRISWLFSHVDIPVVMKDIYEQAIQSGYESALAVYRLLKGKGKYDEREVKLGMHNLHGTTSYDDLGRPDFVVEAVVEDPKVKESVLKDTEPLISQQAVIATNTSSLTVDQLAASLDHPERFGGMHFFNPANKMPLVEVVVGERTSARTVRTIGQLAVRLGKVPVVVRDCPGFLVNRLLMPYLGEALLMAEEGEDFVRIDRVLKGFGMPMGPFRLLDEVGLDIARDVARSLIEGYGERMQVGSFLSELESRNDLIGKKSEAGFYLYDGKKSDGRPNPEMRDLLRQAAQKRSSSGTRSGSTGEDDIVRRPMFAMLNEAARVLEEQIVDDPANLDLALVLGIGFAPFRGGICRYADSLGLPFVRDQLGTYAGAHGRRFEPAPLIERLADEERSFRGTADES